MLKEGVLPTDVGQWLNDNSIPVPSESVGNNHTRKVHEIKRYWNRTTVVRIARDKTYLGYVINGKSKKLSYKSKKIIQVPENEQICIEGQHEALVSKETFDIVQQMINSRKHTRKYKYDFLLRGLIECEECGKKLSILTQKQKSGSEIQYLRCNTYASMTRLKLCTPHSSNCEKTTEAVLDTIRNRLKQYLNEEKFYANAKNIKDKHLYKKNMIKNQINTLENKILVIDKKIESLYDDRLNGILQVSDFERMYLASLDEKKKITQAIEKLKNQQDDTNNEEKLKELTKKFLKMKNISREMLVLMIDKITINEQKEITIYYKFNILNEDTNIIKMPQKNCG